jgi:hypothetical protein
VNWRLRQWQQQRWCHEQGDVEERAFTGDKGASHVTRGQCEVATCGQHEDATCRKYLGATHGQHEGAMRTQYEGARRREVETWHKGARLSDSTTARL